MYLNFYFIFFLFKYKSWIWYCTLYLFKYYLQIFEVRCICLRNSWWIHVMFLYIGTVYRTYIVKRIMLFEFTSAELNSSLWEFFFFMKCMNITSYQQWNITFFLFQSIFYCFFELIGKHIKEQKHFLHFSKVEFLIINPFNIRITFYSLGVTTYME